MASLTEFRREYPQYDHLSDQELVGRLYERYYADAMSREQFDAALGLTESGEAPPTVGEGEYNPFASGEQMFAPPQQGEAPLMMPIGGEEEAFAPLLPTEASEARNRMIPMLDQRSTLQRAQEFLGGTVDASQHGLMLGGDDELTRLIFGEGAERQLEESQAEFAENNPGIATAAEIAGGMGTGAAATRAGATLLRAKNPTILGSTVRGAGEGAAYGGGYGFLDTEGTVGERAKAAGQGAIAGAVAGAPVGAVAGAAGRRLSDSVPTAEHVQAAKTQLYNLADASNVVIDGQAVFGLGLQVRKRLQQEGIPPDLLPESVVQAINLIDKASQSPLPFRGFDFLRQQVRDLGSTPSEQRMIGIIVREMDDFSDGLTAAQTLSGDPAAANAIIRQARAANVVARKSELVTNAFYRASLSASNPRSALQQEFRRIAKNPDLMRQFNAHEQEAIRRIVQGGKIENALSALGRLTSQGLFNFVISSGGAIPALARRGATSKTRGNSLFLDQMVRNGGTPPMLSGTDPLLGALMVGGGIGLQTPPLLPGY